MPQMIHSLDNIFLIHWRAAINHTAQTGTGLTTDLCHLGHALDHDRGRKHMRLFKMPR